MIIQSKNTNVVVMFLTALLLLVGCGNEQASQIASDEPGSGRSDGRR